MIVDDTRFLILINNVIIKVRQLPRSKSQAQKLESTQFIRESRKSQIKACNHRLRLANHSQLPSSLLARCSRHSVTTLYIGRQFIFRFYEFYYV